jgi:type IV secretion system protein VirB1
MPIAFLDLAQNCAPQIAAETIAAVASVESGFQPFAIRINSDYPLADQPKTRAEAVEAAAILIAEGLDIDLGLGGINSADLGRLGLSINDAFDFCLNLKASATLLDGYYRVALQGGATSEQAEIVMLRSYYGDGDASLGGMVQYDSQILAERDRLSARLETIEVEETRGGEPIRDERGGEIAAASADAISKAQLHVFERDQMQPPRWDVFNLGRQSSVLVFSDQQTE